MLCHKTGMTMGARMLFGNSPLVDVLGPLLELGTKRLLELTIDGFETNQVFDVEFFRKTEEGRTSFTITSLGSQTDYGFMVRPGTLTDRSVQVVQIAMSGNFLDRNNWRMVTLVRGDRDQILARPGWNA